jgi:Na+-transporting NADH:ubiquinone oxidoreductase subunit NqrB
VVWERRVLPLGTAQHPGPGYFPLLLAILLIVFGVVLVIQGKGGLAFRSITWTEAPHAAAILGCSIFIWIFLERIGYRLTLLVAMGFLFIIMERINLWLALILTIGFSLGTFWLFDTMLRVPLPRGGWGF